MALISKILIVAGLLAIDAGIILVLVKTFFGRGFRCRISGIIITVAAVFFAVGAYLNYRTVKIVKKPKTVASHVYSTPQANQVIRDIKSLFHKSPAQIEKILGKPDKPVAASEGGELELKSGERVPTTVGTYKHGTVQINYPKTKGLPFQNSPVVAHSEQNICLYLALLRRRFFGTQEDNSD
ncbi:MAG: hypothetical protein M1609_12965, partial [Firmicutes bacterium]|nr:hypothetical protein [Bacillota bacterium]